MYFQSHFLDVFQYNKTIKDGVIALWKLWKDFNKNKRKEQRNNGMGGTGPGTDWLLEGR